MVSTLLEYSLLARLQVYLDEIYTIKILDTDLGLVYQCREMIASLLCAFPSTTTGL
jgi:hypothetical protein